MAKLLSNGRGAWVVAGVVVVVAVALWARGPSKPPAAQPEAVELEDVSVEPVPAANPGYVGPMACAPCHEKRVAEFLKTPHARACRTPDNGPMPDGFGPDKARFATPDKLVRFEMERRGHEFFRSATQGERRVSHRIDLVYGANKADEAFFSFRGNKLFELMTVWLHPTSEWANMTYNPYGGGDFTREAGTRCMECHNTWAEHTPGTMNEFRPDSFILGTTCESCHGPARAHVANPKAAKLVLHPGQLPRERSIEVCTQCHSNANKARGPMFSYRPGEELDKHFRTAVTRHREEDHVANQVKYLRQSKCFTKSDTMTCVTCHDPHKPHAAGHEMRAVALPEQRLSSHAPAASCAKCHKAADCKDQPNLPAAVKTNCVDCHMPQRVWINVHFHTPAEQYLPPVRRWDHRIAVHPEARSEVLLNFHRTNGNKPEAEKLTRELTNHWLGEVEQCRKQHRYFAAIGAAREAVRIEPTDKANALLRELVAVQTKLDADFILGMYEAEQRRVPEAIDRLTRVLAVKPDWAPVHSKLGTLHAASGRYDRAAVHLENVAKYDPDNASGLMMAGWLAYLADRPADAETAFRAAAEIEPFDATTQYRWGLALLRMSRWADAAERFRRAVLIDPRHAGGHQGLSHALRETGKFDEALLSARRAAKLTDYRQADVLVTLTEALVSAGKSGEAATAATKALAAEGPLSPALRRRMEEVRVRK